MKIPLEKHYHVLRAAESEGYKAVWGVFLFFVHSKLFWFYVEMPHPNEHPRSLHHTRSARFSVRFSRLKYTFSSNARTNKWSGVNAKTFSGITRGNDKMKKEEEKKNELQVDKLILLSHIFIYIVSELYPFNSR